MQHAADFRKFTIRVNEQRIARTQIQLKQAKVSRRKASQRAMKLEKKLGKLVAKQVTQSQVATETAMNQPKTEGAIQAPAPPPSAKVQRQSARSRQSGSPN